MDNTHQYNTSARELISLMVDRHSNQVHHWPLFLIHAVLIAGMIVPLEGKSSTFHLISDPLVTRASTILAPLADHLDPLGSQLYMKFIQRAQTPVSTTADVLSAPLTVFNGSDSLWTDFSGLFGIPLEPYQDNGVMPWEQP
jgi:hypothetical protein